MIGAGVSNTPLIELLLSAGARVTVRDKKSREALGEQYDQLAAQGASFVLGEGYLDHLAEPVIFRTPGLHPRHPALERARRAARASPARWRSSWQSAPVRSSP